MLALLQRVSHASVNIENQCVAAIEQGLLILCGFQPDDNETIVDKLIKKCFKYRIFGDDSDKMNLNVCDVNGGVLFVPQFTLAADTNRGLRPSFSSAAPPALGMQLFDYLQHQTKQQYTKLGFGQFGAEMQVELCNDGPVTFLLEG